MRTPSVIPIFVKLLLRFPVSERIFRDRCAVILIPVLKEIWFGQEGDLKEKFDHPLINEILFDCFIVFYYI